MLFTRIDCAPVFQDKALLHDDARRAHLLARCERGLSAAFVARRASRGLRRVGAAAAGRVMMDGIAEVRAAEREPWWARARAAAARWPGLAWLAPPADAPTDAALHPTRFGHNVRDGQGHARSDEHLADYLAPGASSSASDAPLTHLDPTLVQGGAASFRLAHVDVQRAWAASSRRAADLAPFLAALA